MTLNASRSLYKQGDCAHAAHYLGSNAHDPLPPPSYCWQCSRASSECLGHAWEGKVVRTILSHLSRIITCQTSRDAWAKHKDLDPHEAKWLYVDALLKVRILRQVLSSVECSWYHRC